MIAIHTKYIGPTNSRGSRIKAYTVGYGDHKGFTATIGFPHEFDSVRAHFEAVKALVKKNQLDWTLEGMRYGDSADGKGYSFCFDCSTVEAR
jgi:hypothetical protein